ncbi:hypothetical protein L596_018990 [Steinernema carpocapsae]|uniref:Uncharacterized protein n=1 Tax=Steinernema carpocapsae TaxID=34508 RepID=A0A4U5N7S4_STECR|nr:hypothetical protein L596_018990 [Steinernema carpocapsae]
MAIRLWSFRFIILQMSGSVVSMKLRVLVFLGIIVSVVSANANSTSKGATERCNRLKFGVGEIALTAVSVTVFVVFIVLHFPCIHWKIQMLYGNRPLSVALIMKKFFVSSEKKFNVASKAFLKWNYMLIRDEGKNIVIHKQFNAKRKRRNTEEKYKRPRTDMEQFQLSRETLHEVNKFISNHPNENHFHFIAEVLLRFGYGLGQNGALHKLKEATNNPEPSPSDLSKKYSREPKTRQKSSAASSENRVPKTPKRKSEDDPSPMVLINSSPKRKEISKIPEQTRSPSKKKTEEKRTREEEQKASKESPSNSKTKRKREEGPKNVEPEAKKAEDDKPPPEEKAPLETAAGDPDTKHLITLSSESEEEKKKKRQLSGISKLTQRSDEGI